jgi:lantibiotic modifying enzyme
MCDHLSRRDWLRISAASLAGMLVVPRSLPALDSSRGVAPPSDLDVALQAARWIRTSRVETRDGVAWPADPLNPQRIGTDLYNGMPGVVLFHLELYHATGDRAWLEEAKLGASELIARLPSIDASRACGLYTGLAGAAFVLEETHRATGDGKYRDAAKRAVAGIHTHAVRANGGAEWPAGSAVNDIIGGSAGIGLFLLWADRQFGGRDNTPLAVAAARRLMEKGITAEGGTSWPVSPAVTNNYPNFSHGTAGVAYFLATLHQRSADADTLRAAISGAKYLEAIANVEGNGFKVFHVEPGGRDRYYMSWCHGPAGTSRLFQRLAEVTRESAWTDLVTRGARATIASGVPEQQSPGYWNNISQCCGHCGVGEYFIALQRTTPQPEYGDMVRRVAADTVRRGTVVGDGMKWIQAENRVSPNAVVAQTGYMQGAAGVGSFFLHADGLAKKRVSPIVWPDAFV